MMNNELIGTDLLRAKQLLDSGKLVAIPTETVYGLAGNAFDIDAISQIFTVKNRPTFDPLIVHTDSWEKVQTFVQHIPEKAKTLASELSPGPITFLLPKKSLIPDLVTAGLETVAVRIPNHALTLQLLQHLDFPLAAPSANPFGYISPTSAAHVAKQLGDKIPYILDGGNCSIGIESTIVGFDNDEVIVLRKGGVPIEQIEALIGKVKVQTHSSSNPQAPGMLKSHYAPRKALTIIDEQLLINNVETILQENTHATYGYLAFCTYHPNIPKEHQLILSTMSDYAEAAQNLFAYLRQLDEMPIERIYVELLPEENLGRAINDRLRRAATI